jgi:hypothetical protein
MDGQKAQAEKMVEEGDSTAKKGKVALKMLHEKHFITNLISKSSQRLLNLVGLKVS